MSVCTIQQTLINHQQGVGSWQGTKFASSKMLHNWDNLLHKFQLVKLFFAVLQHIGTSA